MNSRHSEQGFINAYIETALWSSGEVDPDNEGEGIMYDDERFTLSEQARARMTADCKQFLSTFGALLDEAIDADGQDMARAGHDFWLTRNEHGAGFWDGDWPGYGDRLTEAAKSFDVAYLYTQGEEIFHDMSYYTEPAE